MPTVIVRSYKAMQADYHAELGRLADLFTAEYFRNCSRRLYLIGRRVTGLDTHNPGATIWQEFTFHDDGAEMPESWEIVTPAFIPRHYTRDHLYSHFREVLKSEPLWIFTD